MDGDFDYNILTPNHIIYGRNINEKCFNDSSSADMSNILALAERHIYNKKRYIITIMI